MISIIRVHFHLSANFSVNSNFVSKNVIKLASTVTYAAEKNSDILNHFILNEIDKM
jgi:hypothetical protein